MADETVSQALSNLEAIKSGEDPRASADDRSSESMTMLEKVQAEVERVFEEHDMGSMARHEIHCYVADWQRKLGNCKYNTAIDPDRYGKRVPGSALDRGRRGHYAIGIAVRNMESGRENWVDTVRHELAHALAHHEFGSSQGHNENWKRIARGLDADPERTKDVETDYNYFAGCPDGCHEWGRQKRSKLIKHPDYYRCNDCNESLVSWEAGDERPTEPGTCNVDW